MEKPGGVERGLEILLITILLTGCLDDEDSLDADSIANLTSGTRPSFPGQGNRAPSIYGSPTTNIEAGASFVFLPLADDPDGDRLAFSVNALPAWASFDPSSGRITGTPATTDIGLTGGITISVSDGIQGAKLSPFRIRVLKAGTLPPPTSPPVITGTPPGTVAAGATYWFQPIVADPDGDTLDFTLSNAPAWLSLAFDSLVGSPTDSDVGLYSGIVLTVSDGTYTDVLGPFHIEVVDAATLKATLDWSTPTTNDDGTPLNDLAGFTLNYGQQDGVYPYTVDVPDPLAISHTVDELVPGTYYFVAKAYNAVGASSDPSNVVVADLQ